MNDTLTDQQTAERKVCQAIAEALWLAACSENHDIAGYKSPVYAGLQKSLVAAIRTAYKLGPARARKVRDLFAEYGPDDSLTSTAARGIESYVQYVRDNPGR